jgi:Pyruvate/2-oxoacid:ferredoxin oxidoreductase gamma subunit
MEITKEEFERYEKVRQSSRTNMFMIGHVVMLTGLDRDKVMEIMKRYGELNEMYPGVRK